MSSFALLARVPGKDTFTPPSGVYGPAGVSTGWPVLRVGRDNQDWKGGKLVIDGAATLGVALIALGMVLTPGPNMMYLVSQTISQGRPAGLISLSGVVTGFVFYVVATAAGLSALFATVPTLFVVVKAAGAAYLLWLAWGIIRDGRRAFRPAELPSHSCTRLFSTGLLTCLLNPKIALMYAALLPQFVEPGRGSTVLQLLQLGGVQILVAGVVNAGWVLVAARLARWLARRDLAERVVRCLTGTLLGGFAIHLGFSQPAVR